MSDYYDRQGNPVSDCGDAVVKAAQERGEDYKRVDRTQVPEADAEVSTVWLGLDHRYGDGPPLIFESMVFGGAMDQACERYSTEAEAVAGHEQMVGLVRREAESIKALAGDAALRSALRRVEATIDVHVAAFDLYDRHSVYDALVKAAQR